MENKSDAIKFLKSLWPNGLDGYLLIWSLDERGRKRSQWFDDISSVRVPDNQDVYFGVGISPEDYGEWARCPSDKIVALPGFWADLDYGTEGHSKSKLPPDEASVWQLLEDLPEPSVVVHSGHGLQAYWLFKEPLRVRSDADRNDIERTSTAFQHHVKKVASKRGWTVDMTHDLARVMRLPGTENLKSQPVPVRIVTVDGPRWDLESLPMASQPTRNADSHTTPALIESEIRVGDFSESKLEILWDLFPDEYQSWAGRAVRSNWDDSPSGRDWAAAKAAAMSGWQASEIAGLIVSGREKRTDPSIRNTQLVLTVRKAIVSANRHKSNPQVLIALQLGDEQERLQLDPRTELERLSEWLGLRSPITRATKTDQDPPVYTVFFHDKSVVLGDGKGLLDMRIFRQKIMEVTGIVVRDLNKKKGEWDAVAQILNDNLEVIEVGLEGRLESLVGTWLDDYLGQPVDLSEEGLWKNHAILGEPFIRDGVVHFSTQGGQGFIQGYIRLQGNQRMEARRLASVLTSLGWTSRQISFRHNERHYKRHFWCRTAKSVGIPNNATRSRARAGVDYSIPLP